MNWKDKFIAFIILASPVSKENWENIINNPWSTSTDPYIIHVFAGVDGLFYSFLMATTVTIAYIKTESLAGPVGTFILLGALLSGLVAGFGYYYFYAATAVAVGLMLYLLVK